MHRQNKLRGLVAAAVLLSSKFAAAQLAPEIGYVHPAGARPGTTIDVIIGGYDWTPDMQLFVHDPRIKLELTGSPSGVLVPDPPYWFGLKARGYAWPLPRQFPAKLTIPADVAPGLIHWQAANANGVSPIGYLHVGRTPEVAEVDSPTGPQVLPALPVTVAGQIRKIEEVDRYQFRATKTGPITIELTARQLKSPLHAMLRVTNAAGQVIADSADTEGRDLVVTIPAQAEQNYTVSLHDLDYAGDRSYVYRLALSEEPRVVAAYPAAGKRGETRRVEFVVANGTGNETVAHDVVFPAQPGAVPNVPFAISFRDSATRGKPAADASRSVALGLSDIAERAEAELPERKLEVPGAVTGSIEARFGSDKYRATFKMGEKWVIRAEARAIGSPLDLDLAILDAEGKQIAAQEDAPGTTDPELEFAVPKDGEYQLMLTDRSGASGSRAANYRLSCQPVAEDFQITLPPLLTVPLAGQSKLAVKAARLGGFAGPIQLQVTGLPAGLTPSADLTIAEKKNDLSIDLTSAADAPANASLVEVTATAMLNGQSVTRPVGKLVIATIMKPRIKITPDGLDDVRKVHRGSTYLAPLTIERLEGYQGELVLEMTAKQQRHRQGLASGEYTVKADANRADYPIFVPEWMETTKTSRMILNGSVKVPDPKGNVRTLLQRMELRIGILPEGAMLKLSHNAGEPVMTPGGEFRVPLTISRSEGLREPVKISLSMEEPKNRFFTADPVTIPADRKDAELLVRFPKADPGALGEVPLIIRAESQKDGFPVVSETTVLITVR